MLSDIFALTFLNLLLFVLIFFIIKAWIPRYLAISFLTEISLIKFKLVGSSDPRNLPIEMPGPIRVLDVISFIL